MIEIRNLHLPLSGGKASGLAYDPDRLRDAVARKLGCRPGDLGSCTVVRRSVDARRARDVHYVATVRTELAASDPKSACWRASTTPTSRLPPWTPTFPRGFSPGRPPTSAPWWWVPGPQASLRPLPLLRRASHPS